MGLIFTPLYHTHPTPLKFKPENIYILGIYRSLAWTIPKWDGAQEMPDTYIHVPFS